MNVYLAALECKLGNKRIIEQIQRDSGTISILGSYFSISRRNEKLYASLIPHFKDFVLDSGAFTFMNSERVNIDWDKYLEDYAAFIKANRVEKFFELDIDVITGYDKVKEYRSRLEGLTGRPSIPVWHRSRGYAEFIRLCEEYPYIAVGGIAIKHIRREEYKHFTRLIKEAHKRNCKIHALGFTNPSELRKYHFDSVDSSSWTCGGRYGSLYEFRGGQLRLTSRKDGTRVKDIDGIDRFNFGEWVKFQKYAEVHL